MKENNMDLDNLTLGQIKSLKSLFGDVGNAEHPFEVGKLYLIRTVTMYYIGKLEWVGNMEIRLSSASWIADCGRFHDALSTGTLSEVEPFTDDVIIGRGSIVDATVWKFESPRGQK